MSDLIENAKSFIRKKYPPFDYTVMHDTPVTPLTKPLNEFTRELRERLDKIPNEAQRKAATADVRQKFSELGFTE